MRKYFVNFLKIGVTLVGLYVVLRQVEITAVLALLQQVNLGWVLVSFLLVNASMVLRAYRWLILLRGVGASVRFGRLVELYFVGNFFNMFLLSGFGGDVVRVLEVARDTPGSIATGTVILDRFTGLLMLFVMALLALPWRPAGLPDWLTWFIVGGAVGGVATLILLMKGNTLLHRIKRPRHQVLAVDGPLGRLLAAVAECGWRAVGGALFVSTLFNLLLALWWKTSSMALGLDIYYGYMVLIVPVLSALLLIPSVSGLGPNEMMAPVLFAAAGVEVATAVALSFLVFLTVRLSGLLGAPVYLWTIIRRKK